MIKIKLERKQKQLVNELEKDTYAYKKLKKIKPDVKAPMSSLIDGAYRKVIPVNGIKFTVIKDKADDFANALIQFSTKSLEKYFAAKPDSLFIDLEKKFGSDRYDQLHLYLVILLSNIMEKFGLTIDISQRQAYKEIEKTLPDGRQVKSVKRVKLINILKDYADLRDNPTPSNKSYKFFEELYNATNHTDSFQEFLDQLTKNVVSFQEAVDIFDRNAYNVSLSNDPASIVLSRVPVDIMRMSDFSHLESCHSPPYPSRQKVGGQYHLCAIQEAESSHGMIAYLFDKNPNQIPEDEMKIINSTAEFMVHKEEGIDIGWNPVSRVRIRSYHIRNANNGTVFNIHVPSATVYGASFDVFLKAVVEYFRNAQKGQIDLIKQAANAGQKLEVGLLGGFYHDGTEELVCALFAEVPQETFVIDESEYENVEGDIQQDIDEAFDRYIFDKVIFNVTDFDVDVENSSYTYRGQSEKIPGELYAVYDVIYSLDPDSVVSKMRISADKKKEILDIINDFDILRRLMVDEIKVAGTTKDNITVDNNKNIIEIRRRLEHKFPDQKKEMKVKIQEFESVCNLLKDPYFYLQTKQVTEEVYYFKRLAGIIK